jgi:hypothetical protein
MRKAQNWRDLLGAWALATVVSGIPSTLYALLAGGDPLAATKAAATMVLPVNAPLGDLLAAAALVHAAVSLFWALVLALALPRKRVVLWATLAAAGIAVFDLLAVARAFFPEVYALPFWAQLADHLLWGVSLGSTLAWRRKKRLARQ